MAPSPGGVGGRVGDRTWFALEHGVATRLASTELPGVDVGDVSDHLSPAWVPLPPSTIAHLCAGTAGEQLDMSTLATRESFGPSPSWWKLVWVNDDLGEGSW